MQGNNRREATLGNTAKTNECWCSLTIQLIELFWLFSGKDRVCMCVYVCAWWENTLLALFSNLCVCCHIGVWSIKQKEILHWPILGLKLQAHFKCNTGTEGVASYSIRPVWLNLFDTVHIVGCKGLDAVQRGSWWRGDTFRWAWLDNVLYTYIM